MAVHAGFYMLFSYTNKTTLAEYSSGKKNITLYNNHPMDTVPVKHDTTAEKNLMGATWTTPKQSI